MRISFLTAAASACALVAACSVFTSLDGLRGGATTDAGAGLDVTPGSDGAVDASDGAIPTPPSPLSCAVDGVPQTIVTNALFDRRIDVHASAKGVRIAVDKASDPQEFFDVSQTLTGATSVAIPILPAGALSSMFTYEGGWVVLSWDGNQAKLKAFLVDDAQTAAGTLTAIDTTPSIPGGASDVMGAVAAIDTAKGTFLVLYSYKDPALGDYPVHAGLVTLPGGAVTPLTIAHRFAVRPAFETNSILVDRTAQKATVLMPAPQGLGDMTAFSVGFKGEDFGLRTLVGAQGAHFLGSFAQLLPSATTNGVALLEGDLQNAAVPLGMRVSMVGEKGATAFDPGTFPSVTPLKATELVIDGQSTSWHNFTGGPHLALAGRATQTGKGVNFLWFDGAGNLRARKVDANAIAPTEQVRAAGAAFNQEPTALLAKLTVAWIDQGHQVRMAAVTCVKP